MNKYNIKTTKRSQYLTTIGVAIEYTFIDLSQRKLRAEKTGVVTAGF